MVAYHFKRFQVEEGRTTEPAASIQHHIVTTSLTVFTKFCQLLSTKLKATKVEYTALLQFGVFSPYANLSYMAPSNSMKLH